MTKTDIKTDITNLSTPNFPGAMAHLVRLDGSAASLARMQDYIGQYVCVHSAPSAWFGCVVDASIDNGVISVDLADGGLWTQGQTKDLLRPARTATADLESRRDGVVTVMAVTALQPAAAFTEGTELKDKPELRRHRVRAPRDSGLGLNDYARYCDIADPADAAASILELYMKVGAKKGGDENRGNMSGLVNMVKNYAAEKRFPVRATASILLHEARKYVY